MLLLILSSLLAQPDQIDYYYFTTEGCVPCKRQLPIIEKLQAEGFNFEILDDQKSINNFKITAFPTIIIELIDYKIQKVTQIRLKGFRSYSELKVILTNRGN